MEHLSDAPLMNSAEMQNEAGGDHHQETLRERTKRYVRTLGHFVRLLFGLITDSRVDRNVKLFVGAVLAYIFAPVDFIPELFSGLFGMLDDFVLTGFALNVILNWVDPEIVKSHWRGSEDLLQTVQKTVKNAELLVPDAILKKIQIWVGKYAPSTTTAVVQTVQPKEIATPPPLVEEDDESKRKRGSGRRKKTDQ